MTHTMHMTPLILLISKVMSGMKDFPYLYQSHLNNPTVTWNQLNRAENARILFQDEKAFLSNARYIYSIYPSLVHNSTAYSRDPK